MNWSHVCHLFIFIFKLEYTEMEMRKTIIFNKNFNSRLVFHRKSEAIRFIIEKSIIIPNITTWRCDPIIGFPCKTFYFVNYLLKDHSNLKL